MLSDAEIESYIHILSKKDGDEGQMLVQKIASDVEQNINALAPLQIAIVARTMLGLEATIVLIAPFLCISQVRGLLLKEIGGYLSVEGQPQRALEYFEIADAEGLLDLDYTLLMAAQYARLGDKPKALSLLSQINSEDPAFSQKINIHLQFFEYLWKFDFPTAHTLLFHMVSRFQKQTLSELEQNIRIALQEKEPYLLLRLGDGEGAHMRVAAEEDVTYRDYYRANRSEFAKIWFKDQNVIDDPSFDRLIDTFNDAIIDADCIGGVADTDGLDLEYRMGSRRGIAALVNNIRKMLILSDHNPSWAPKTSIQSITIHYDLLLGGALKRLLQSREHVGLISCQTRLPEALKRTYDIRDVEYFCVPGEQIHGDKLGAAAIAGSHWPDRFDELCEILDRPADRRGQLFLVAAGILGKVYAQKLKRSGAVVLDIGAVADLWMGKMTRTFPHVPDDVALDLGPKPLVLVDVGGLGGLGPEWEAYVDDIQPIVFEPNPPEAASIRAVIARSPGGMVVEKALSSWPERRTLHVTKSLGCTSLLRPNQRTLAKYSIAPAFRVTHTIDVECVRYDSLVATGEVPMPEAIKIDVQGFEYQVLEGFGNALTTCLAIKLEAHLYPIYEGQKLLHDLVALLLPFGLTLSKIEPVDHFDGDLVEVDAWFSCSAERAGELDERQRDKLRLIERVWDLPSHRKIFGPDQFA